MRKRGEGPLDGATRLVYSTGGEKEPVKTITGSPVREARATGGKGIRLRLETRPGGRVVTIVLGLAGSEAELAALAKALKSECGTGGTVKDGVVELQGDHRTAAQAALATRGLKARV
jgi:translation initiation factor 1